MQNHGFFQPMQYINNTTNNNTFQPELSLTQTQPSPLTLIPCRTIRSLVADLAENRLETTVRITVHGRGYIPHRHEWPKWTPLGPDSCGATTGDGLQLPPQQVKQAISYRVHDTGHRAGVMKGQAMLVFYWRPKHYPQHGLMLDFSGFAHPNEDATAKTFGVRAFVDVEGAERLLGHLFECWRRQEERLAADKPE